MFTYGRQNRSLTCLTTSAANGIEPAEDECGAPFTMKVEASET
jgi:hypothetical protein